MEFVTQDISAEAMQHMEAAEVGRALRGFGLNPLCPKVIPLVESIASLLEMQVMQANDDYAIIAGPEVGKSLIIQLHDDPTYDANPLPLLLPEAGARGDGARFRLFDMDPDAAARWVEVEGWHILQPLTDRPHGLNERYLLDLEGYCWTPHRVIA